jgi:cadmium resistance protein CadD (predicted permease)
LRNSLLAALGFAVATFTFTFTSTNIDDIFVLAGFFSDPGCPTRSIVRGQYLGIGALVATSLICSLLVFAIPRPYVDLLGFSPILLGLVKLWTVWRSGIDYKEAEPRRARTSGSKVLTMAGVTVANGGDNLGIYIPMFAVSTASDIILGAFAVMTRLWCGAVHYLVHHPKPGAPIRRLGPSRSPHCACCAGHIHTLEARQLPSPRLSPVTRQDRDEARLVYDP